MCWACDRAYVEAEAKLPLEQRGKIVIDFSRKDVRMELSAAPLDRIAFNSDGTWGPRWSEASKGFIRRITHLEQHPAMDNSWMSEVEMAPTREAVRADIQRALDYGAEVIREDQAARKQGNVQLDYIAGELHVLQRLLEPTNFYEWNR